MGVTVEWNDRYSVHDAVIDREHRKLFDLANEVFAILDPNREVERFKTAVKELFRYMEHHFAHEEALMAKVGFPGRASHAARHGQAVAHVTHLLTTSKSLSGLANQLRHFMLDWVLRHIMVEDRAIAGSVEWSRLLGTGGQAPDEAAAGSLAS